MGRIDQIFGELRSTGRSALMPFVTGGHPDLDTTAKVLPALERAGASIAEIGLPFSDPIADGPTIASAMHGVLESGVTPGAVLDRVRSVRDQVELGLLAMVSHSIVRRIGLEAFVTRAHESGIDGLIVPDIDADRAATLAELTAARDMSFTMLVAPTTRPARLETLCGLCSGFIYLLARVGITGERADAPDVTARVAEIREHTDLPIAVGFGISRPEHVAAVTSVADAAIVGSALVRRMDAANDPVAAAASFIEELATGLTRRDPEYP